MKKLMCLKNVNSSDRFYTCCSDKKELLMSVGETISYPSGIRYEILGFVDDINDHEKARRILYPSIADENIAIANYIHNIAKMLYQ